MLIHSMKLVSLSLFMYCFKKCQQAPIFSAKNLDLIMFDCFAGLQAVSNKTSLALVHLISLEYYAC